MPRKASNASSETDAALGRAAVGSVVFFCLAPGLVAGLVPYLITGWRPAIDRPLLARVCGAGLILLGLLSLIESFVRFVVRGHGTPAPMAPPRRLVVTGQYQHVRNPMYVALEVIVVGQAAWLGSWALLVYALVLSALFHLRVLMYEEPALEEQFGAEFDEYRRNVRRWLPRARPWRSDSKRGTS